MCYWNMEDQIYNTCSEPDASMESYKTNEEQANKFWPFWIEIYTEIFPIQQ